MQLIGKSQKALSLSTTTALLEKIAAAELKVVNISKIFFNLNSFDFDEKSSLKQQSGSEDHVSPYLSSNLLVDKNGTSF